MVLNQTRHYRELAHNKGKASIILLSIMRSKCKLHEAHSLRFPKKQPYLDYREKPNLLHECLSLPPTLCTHIIIESTVDITESPDQVEWDYIGSRQIDEPLGQWLPTIAGNAYMAPSVVLTSQIIVYDGPSIWNKWIIHNDFNTIIISFISNSMRNASFMPLALLL